MPQIPADAQGTIAIITHSIATGVALEGNQLGLRLHHLSSTALHNTGKLALKTNKSIVTHRHSGLLPNARRSARISHDYKEYISHHLYIWKDYTKSHLSHRADETIALITAE